MALPESVTPALARGSLRAIADGVPPHNQITRWLTVGQGAILARLETDIEKVAAGGFESLLLLGNPGAGKSHLLTSLLYETTEAGFVTAFFSHDAQSRISFNRPDQIYRRIIETMRLPDADLVGVGALESLLNRWVDTVIPTLTGSNRSIGIAFKLGEANVLPAAQTIHPRTRAAIVGYLMAVEQSRDAERAVFLDVLGGPGTSSTDLVRAATRVGLDLRWIGYTPTPYDTKYYFGKLGLLITILRTIGYKGMVILFDEVTAIVELRSRSRDVAYRVMDSLLFNDFNYSGLYTVFAYLPAFVNQLRADRHIRGADLLRRWNALWDKRMEEVEPLNDLALVELGHRLALLHSRARSWRAWDNVEGETRRWARQCSDEQKSTREFVRGLLDRMDDAYAH